MRAKDDTPQVSYPPRIVPAPHPGRGGSSSSVPSIAYAGLGLGVLLFSVLIAYQGAREVGGALAVAGPGLLVVASFHLVPMLANAIGWRCLLPRRQRLSVLGMLRARWIGESINGLLPVLQVGGNVVKARLIAARGVDAPVAGATVVVDVMLMVSTQVVYTLIGVAVLVALIGEQRVVVSALIGAGIMTMLLAAFYLAQQRGLFGALARRIGGMLGAGEGVTTNAAALDAAIHALYRRSRAVAVAGAWHLGSWIVGAGEVWLALYFLGHPIGLAQAVLLESLGQAVRTAGFVVPGALGVQEGGYLVLGTVLGLTPETSLALSLAKRVREIVLGIPGLLVWQAEGATSLVRGGKRGEA